MRLFLRIATGFAAAISQVHKRWSDPQGPEATQCAREIPPPAKFGSWASGSHRAFRENASHLNLLNSSPERSAYMAPEQTGRTNRSIDARSDLYALGVTLYEMLTGILPFTASDPMEWVHCQIARRPVPPGELLHNVPDPISAIIMKLLCQNS